VAYFVCNTVVLVQSQSTCVVCPLKQLNALIPQSSRLFWNRDPGAHQNARCLLTVALLRLTADGEAFSHDLSDGGSDSRNRSSFARKSRYCVQPFDLDALAKPNWNWFDQTFVSSA